MKIKHANVLKDNELPMQFSISFDKALSIYKKYADKKNENHPYHIPAKKIINEIQKYPELTEGFSDFSLLEKYKEQIELILDPLFPEALSLNEIKAASIPFSFASFKFTTRFENILKDAGKDFVLRARNFDDDIFYIAACTWILGVVHNYYIDFRRPFFFDIPNKNGEMRNFRAAYNGDMGEVIPTENAPEITEDDIKILLDSFDNINIWKEKFPPNSYIFKGFGIMNLFDVTTDETISAINTNLLQSDENLIKDLRENLAKFYNIKDLMLGFSVFEMSSESLEIGKLRKSESLILDGHNEVNCNNFFCGHILDEVFKKQKSMAISNVEKYGEHTNQNGFYKNLKSKGIGSIIIIPIKKTDDSDLAIIEIASPRPFELNSINQHKFQDIIPVFESAVERASKEYQNILEATIQEFYTSIHPSVKWRFYDAAEKYHKALYNKQTPVKMDEIVFEEVFPLYGQLDIKGSSLARNHAIQEDLTNQLSMAVNVLKEALKNEELPIYDELIFRINEYLVSIEKGLKSGDEVGILSFLKSEIYPVFNHISQIHKDLAKKITVYKNRLDPDLHVIYERRKEYEHSVTILNDRLAMFLDKKQEEAQTMFPHYYERYKTDGVEFNMYIGQSLVKDKTYEDLYLYNLRLWQLQTMYEMENVAYAARDEMDHQLRVASLILVHGNPLAIKFRMDEKQFDVDGAYNIRYEIIKKRIDKAFIKGTKERITVPGKIAIIYSQDRDAIEYLKYIKYLQSKQFFGKVEELEVEDLQGVSGLKALRVEVIYQQDFNTESTIDINELMKQIHT
jgi:molybdopterin converting factor small subunit